MKVKSRYDIIIGEYPFHKELKKEIVPLLEKYPDQPNINSNVKATHTEWDWNPNSSRIKRLKDIICTQACSWCKFHFTGEKNPALYFTNFWANVYRKGDYANPHDHLPTFYSFVYFLKTKWYDSPLVMTDFKEKIRPKEGRYVIFPGHLRHHVPKHRYKDVRITLSGNLLIKE